MTATISIALYALLALSVAVLPAQAKPRTATPSIQEVKMVGTDTREYRVPVTVNDVGPYWGLIDTGATGVVLPYPLYLELWRTGAITGADTLRPTLATMADGRTMKTDQVLITLTLGAWRLTGVTAMIGTQTSDFLIGSNVLQRFQSFGIDHTRSILRLGQPR
jgi:predicted aspartyl protease